MSEIDWDKAPEGATHAGMNQDGSLNYFYNLESKVADYEYWNVILGDDKWHIGRGTPAAWPIIHRPSPAWSGGGIPAAGSICEVRQKTPSESSFDWEECRIAMINTGADGLPQVCTIDKRGDFAIYYPATDIVEFRPIRTPEQIAADEREAVVTYMQCIIGGIFDKESIASPHEISEKLYEAGLRLIK